jgi:hypothetical protein
MRISARALNRSTLARQLLLRREALRVGEAVRRVVALQAQHAASPYMALWNRLAEFEPVELDAAFARHELVKATLMRITLHGIHADDYRDFREAMEPTLRAARLNDKRFRVSGLTVADVHALIPDLVGYANRPRTGTEMETWLENHLGAPKPGAWWALRQYAPLWHAPTGAVWSFGQRPSFVAARAQPVLGDPDVAALGLQRLVERYLKGFGPASMADIAQFALYYRPLIKGALQALAGELKRLEGPDGKELYDIPGGLLPAEDTPAPPRLMAMWDSVLLAHADRSRIIPTEYRKLVTRSNGDVLPTLLVDGYVAGVWRQVEGGIEATAFHRLPSEAWEGLAAEASGLLAFLADRDSQVYRRYHHWWTTLPGAEVRVLPG